MHVDSTAALGPLELTGAALSSPLFSLLLAFVATGCVLLVASRPARTRVGFRRSEPRSVRATYSLERRTLGIAATSIVVAFVVEFVLRGYVLTDLGVSWWRFAFPLICGLVGILATVTVIRTRGTASPESPVIDGTRRSWRSFTSRSAAVTASVAISALIATTISSGLVSSPNGQGQYVWLAVPIPNESDVDPLRLPFYGWAYGAPVLVCLVALTAATWWVLDRNAARPYRRPQTVSAERVARRETARNATLLTTAATLLSVGGAWRLIANGGSVSHLEIIGDDGISSYDAAWRFAELAVAAGWCAPLLETIAFTLLLFVVTTGLRREPAPSESAATDGTPIEARVSL